MQQRQPRLCENRKNQQMTCTQRGNLENRIRKQIHQLTSRVGSLFVGLTPFSFDPRKGAKPLPKSRPQLHGSLQELLMKEILVLVVV